MNNDKKDHIINTAIELFAEKGFEGSSIRDLAAKADVNLAMVNYYFGSKDKLFEALVEQKASFMRGVLDELIANSTLSELEKIDLIIESYVGRFLAQPLFHKVLQQELLVSQRASMHENVINLFIKNTQDVVAIIEKGIRKKVFRKVDPQMTFASIIGTINQIMISKTLCNRLMNKPADYNPYTDEHFKKRILTHIKQIIHSHLLINNDL
jgi:AcrR family transcriptional regulator